MQFKAETAFAATRPTDALVLFRSSQDKTLRELVVPDPALQSAARAAIRAGEFTAKRNETLFVHGGRGDRRLLVVGLGDADDGEALREAAAVAARMLDGKGVKHATFLIPGRIADFDATGPVVEGAGLGLYRFDRYKQSGAKPKLRRASIAPEKGRRSNLAGRVKEARALVAAVGFARDLGNLPGNICTPVHLAREARKLASEKMKVRVYNRADIKRAQEPHRTGRQGRDLRHRRHLDQAVVRHGGHEVRHGRRCCGLRPDARGRRAQAEDQHSRAGARDRQHAGRLGLPAG
jgi:leucyl aminopeptidase